MSPFAQFLSSVLGGGIGIAIAFPAFKRNRQHLVNACCGVFTVAFTLPIYDRFLEASSYGLLILPLLGGALGGVGALIGSLVGRRFTRGETK